MVISRGIHYPESDGQPMADNTEQFHWIVLLKNNLDALFADDPNVLVVGDLLWYPVEGQPKIRRAPDVTVVFGRPKGRRGSYRQWEEDNIAPQVTFEIRSPRNTDDELDEKRAFYDRYGVEEYYLYDPDSNALSGWQRQGSRLVALPDMHEWVSPRLGIRFAWSDDDLVLYRPDGTRFLSYEELSGSYEAERRRAEAERRRAEAERRRAAQAEREAQALRDRLRALGIDPHEP